MRTDSEITELVGGILRLRAANPGPMTGTGTNTYLLMAATGAVVIDPGPDLVAHLDAIITHLGKTPLRAILITHAHLDHTALTPALVAATSARVLAFGGATAGRSAQMKAMADQGMAGGGEGADAGFAPDDLLADGQTLDVAGMVISVIHTPGHMGGHLCFGYGDTLFSGDHVMGWSTSLISPPDGDMADYMASLARLSADHWSRFLPGHGNAVSDTAARLAALIAHRRAREAAILAAVRAQPTSATALAALIYTDTAPALLPAAARNILAHLIDLHDRNLISTQDPITPTTAFTAI